MRRIFRLPMGLFPRVGLLALPCAVVVLTACGGSGHGGESSQEIIQSYRDNHRVSYFSIPPSFASLFVDERQPGGVELKSILRDTEGISLLRFEHTADGSQPCHFQELNSRLEAIDLQELAHIRRGDGDVRVKVSQAAPRVEEMVVLVSRASSLYCIRFEGQIDPQAIINLAKPQNLAILGYLNVFTGM